MKLGEKKIYIIISFILVILGLNIFLMNVLNEFFLSLIFVGFSILSVLLLGYEKDNHVRRKVIMILMSFYSISYIILLYGIGLFTGFVWSGYSLEITKMIRNVVPVMMYIVSSEMLRYILCKKGEKRKSIFILIILIFFLSDMSIGLTIYNIHNKEILEFVSLIVFPSLFKNIVLTLLCSKYGYKGNILYRMIMECYIYIVPILPNFNIYMESVLMTVFPVILYYIMINSVERKKRESIRESKVSKGINIIIVLIMVVLIGLNSNLFRYWIAVVGSGSMEPTIHIGDIIIIDKGYKEYKVGDVIVFKVKGEMYTHRIIKIEKDGMYTKGDRKGNVEDDWVVKEKDVIGKVKYKVPYVGMPSLWLKEIMEGKE